MTLTTTKHFAITEYHRLAELGFFTEDDQFELIKGEIIKMVAKGKAHSTFNRRLIRELTKLLDDLATVQAQDPIFLPPDSEPEPDIAILRNRTDDYLTFHPHPSDILLVIEVSDSSLKYDQEVKLPLYAEAGILHYWIFNLVNYYLEYYHEPYQDLQGKFGYRHKSILLPNESVKLPSFPDFNVDLYLDLSKIFPG